jgi:multicomponent Na+:H+ antiporter subunit E
MKSIPGISRPAAFAQRAAFFAAVWWALVEGRLDSWLFAVPVIAAAALASAALQPRPWQLRPVRAFGLLAWFLRRALVAGFDVALRALRTQPRLAPGFVWLRLRLPHSGSRVLLADALSLLPGTLSADLRGQELELHVLDCSAPVERDVRELELRIAAALRLELEHD